MGESLKHLCRECGEAGTAFINFVKGGKVVSATFCAHHAETEGLLHPNGYELLDKAETSARHVGGRSLRCPVCDCSQRDFERQGRFGCPACYSAFTGLLPPLFSRMHKGAEHRGKIPLRGAEPAALRQRLVLLQSQLNDAVRAERYEGAAQTRDAIAQLQAKLLPAPSSGPTPPARPAEGA